jgi:hypothetical protein
MTDAAQATPPSPRDADVDPGTPAALHDSDGAEGPGAQKDSKNAAAFDAKALTDGTLQFLATASNETLGACLVGLGAGTYLILGRVGLVLIGVVGGVVLHATWEGHARDGDNGGQQGKRADTRRRELGVDVAHRVLDWRDARTHDKSVRDDDDNDTSDLSLKLYSGKPLDYSEFKPETAAALTELTDAVIRDYVKYVLCAVSVDLLSDMIQVVVRSSPAFRRIVPKLVPPDIHCSHPRRVCTSLPEATSR